MAHSTVGMIFAAGKGTRLAPFTDSHPKALAEVGGVTMLERVIRRLVEDGITDIVVNVHHFAEQIVDFLEVNKNFDANIVISDETALLLDTGGALVKADAILSRYDNVLIHNVDILSDIDLKELITHHSDLGAEASLLVSDRKSTRHLYFDDKNRLVGWGNDKTGQTIPDNLLSEIQHSLKPMAFGGIHIINTKKILPLLNTFTSEPVFSIIPFYAMYSRKLDIRGYVPAAKYNWYDIGSPDKLLEAERALPLMKF